MIKSKKNTTSNKTASGNQAFKLCKKMENKKIVTIASNKTASGNQAFKLTKDEDFAAFIYMVTKPQAVIRPLNMEKLEEMAVNSSNKTASGNQAFKHGEARGNGR